jgi:hypothetical protein
MLARTLELAKMNKLETSEMLIGYTPEELIVHLNTGDYTWADYMLNTPGDTKFHVDHIIPLSYFTSRLETNSEGIPTKEGLRWVSLANSLENLRVWPATDNLSKHDTLDMDLVEKHNLYHLL